MSAETVPVKEEVQEEVIEQVVEKEPDQTPENETPVAEQKVEQVPLSALQKERKKRQEVEQELRWMKEQQQQKTVAPPAPDETLFEAATKEDLGKAKVEMIRSVEERSWVKNNPEKKAEIDEKLQEFLKQRPNLVSAIENAPNRYEEAWELMDKLTPKQKSALRPAAPTKKEAPGSPSAVPKGAAVNQVMDFAEMSDQEFNAWRATKRQKRR